MFKRDFKLFVKCLAGAGILCLILAAVCILAASVMMRTSNTDNTVKVAVVDNEDSVVSRILINAVAKTDYLSSLLVTESMSEDAAMESLASGDSVAAIILPDGFIDNIQSGIESHGTVYLSSKAAAQAEIIKASVKFGEHLLVSGQYGVFSGSRLLYERGLDNEARKSYLTRANTGLLAEALSANEKYFTVTELDFDGTGLKSEEYYILSWLTMLLYLLALFFIPLFTRDCTQSMLTRLRACGVGEVRFMSAKLGLMFMLRLLVLIAAVIAVPKISGGSAHVSALLCAITCAAFVTVSSAALTMCFGDGITSNALITIGGMFLCGGLVPRQLLPDGILLLGDLTPFGAARALIAPALGAPVDPLGVAAAAVYTCAAILLMHHKLRRTVSGRA